MNLESTMSNACTRLSRVVGVCLCSEIVYLSVSEQMVRCFV